MSERALLVLFVALSGCGGAEPASTSSQGAGTAGADRTPVVVPSGDLAAALAGAHRSDENRARDQYRHPRETLGFFGIQPTMTVVELSPGRGWYTEILAPYLRDGGKLVVGIPSAEGERAEYHQRFIDFQATHPELYDRIELGTFEPPAPIDLGADGSADMVLTFRNVHNWTQASGDRQAFEAAFRVLKPGGIFGVVEHRATEGTTASETARTGYIPEAYIVELAQGVGFELVDRSEVNANPRDDHDHPDGVWSLPPTLRGGEATSAEFRAIGESDRMTLKFQKPAAATVPGA